MAAKNTQAAPKGPPVRTTGRSRSRRRTRGGPAPDAGAASATPIAGHAARKRRASSSGFSRSCARSTSPRSRGVTRAPFSSVPELAKPSTRLNPCRRKISTRPSRQTSYSESTAMRGIRAGIALDGSLERRSVTTCMIWTKATFVPARTQRGLLHGASVRAVRALDALALQRMRVTPARRRSRPPPAVGPSRRAWAGQPGRRPWYKRRVSPRPSTR